jgi:hypothetical protein
MVAFTLESLVLRGSVLQDGTVSLRRETRGAAYRRTPAVRLSMRHPSPGWVQGFGKPNQRPDHAAQNRVDVAAIGAGRSRSRAGVLRRSPASLAGRAVQPGWRLTNPGGPLSTAAACLCPAGARSAAPVNEPDGRKPFGRTPPASTRESGLR